MIFSFHVYAASSKGETEGARIAGIGQFEKGEWTVPDRGVTLRPASIVSEGDMTSKDYAVLMARYNIWQNESQMAAAGGLSDQERQRDRGAFFGSIMATLSHLYWGDRTWLSRFSGAPAPEKGFADSTRMFGDWDSYCAARRTCDQQILDWAQGIDPQWLDGDLTWYSGAAGREMVKPRAMLVIHMFNHQTHHRGQVHAMLTAAGARPDDTDLMLLSDRHPAA